jgi:hypothetical protein
VTVSGAHANEIAVEEATILARSLMSLTARSMNYLVAASVACSRIEPPIGSWFKVAADYGDWYIRLDRDGNEYHGISRPEAPVETADVVVSVPSGATPVTDVLRSLLSGLREHPSSVFDPAGRIVEAGAFIASPYVNQVEALNRAIIACDPLHRSTLVEELLELYRSHESGALVDQLRAFRTWIESEHRGYATDALVPALMAAMVSALEQSDKTSVAERVRAFMQPEMFTSVGLIRDRFLSAPPFRAEPRLVVGAAAALMTSVDKAVKAARDVSNVKEMGSILYESLPACVAARWLFAWCMDSPLGEVGASAQAQWRRADETLARMRAAFLHQVLDLGGQEWERLALEIEEVRRDMGEEEARRQAKLVVNRHLLYPTSHVECL